MSSLEDSTAFTSKISCEILLDPFLDDCVLSFDRLENLEDFLGFALAQFSKKLGNLVLNTFFFSDLAVCLISYKFSQFWIDLDDLANN